MVDYKFNDKEVETMDYMRETYAQAYNPVSCETWLNSWRVNKSNLFKIFGNSLIVEFPYEVELNNAGKMKDLSNNSIYDEVLEAIYGFCSNRKNFLEEDWIYSSRRLVLYDAFRDAEDLFNNRLPREFKLRNGKKYPEGARLMSTLQKINKDYHFISQSLFEDFRNLVSRYTQTKKTKGTFVLSIHPLDYMTMSDNRSNWSSCMSWKNCGSYRVGTVEMLNSPYVVVGYTKGEDDMEIFYDHYWNNKNWRILYIVSEEIITSVKAYPFFSEGLIKVGLNKLRELAESNIGWYYEDTPNSQENGRIPVTEDTQLFFTTEDMYNDFGCETTHYYYKAKEFVHLLERETDVYKNRYGEYSLCYSGPFICCNCGQAIGTDDSEYLVCYECTPSYECCRCGCRLREDEVYIYDDEEVCEDCYWAYKDEEEEEI